LKVVIDKASARKLNISLTELAKVSKKTLGDVIVPQARLFCVDLAHNTKPVGGAKGKSKMMNNVKGTIGLIYPSVGSVFNMIKAKNEGAAGAFAATMNNRRAYVRAQKIVNKYIPEKRITIGQFDDGKLHREQAGKKITRRLLSTSPTKVETYKRKAAKMVGFAKSGFATAARMIGGTRGIPGYVSRLNGPGSAKVAGVGNRLTVTIINSVKYINKALSQDGVRKAANYRDGQIFKNIKREMRTNLEKTTKGVAKV